MFKDAWNATQEEIKKWAYSDEGIPMQDWELALARFENIPMICTLVEDKQCKATSFFLCVLYVFAGDTIRGGDNEEIEKLSELIKKIEDIAKSEKLKLWIERSQLLIDYPEYYAYTHWGPDSKYAYE